jgi:hypothetical protein
VTTKYFNVKTGITSGNITLDADSGNVSATNLTVTGSSNLGNIGNITITGGTSGQVVTTDGAGNLSFTSPSSMASPAPMPYYIFTGEIYTIPVYFQGLFGTPITIEGTLDVEGILVEV